MSELNFPITIQQMSENTGIPERTLRLYCDELMVRKFGKNYAIARTDYFLMLERDKIHKNWHKSERKNQ